jgi:hypothetical protein
LRRILQETKVELPPDQAALLEDNMVVLVKSYQKSVQTGDSTHLREVVEDHFRENRKDVMRTIAKLSDQIETRTETIAKNRSKHYETVIGGFEEKLNAVRSQVSEVGSLPMEEALKDPKSLNSIVSVASQQDEGFKKEVDRIKAHCATIASGVRPFDVRDRKWQNYLDPEDRTRLTPEGEELRRKEVFQHEAAQKQLPKTLAEMWSASLLVPQLVERLAKYEARVKDDQSEPDLTVSEERISGQPKSVDFDNIEDIRDVKNPFI